MKKTRKKSAKSAAPQNRQLAKFRTEITSIDRQIAKLCSQRLTLTGKVFDLKRKHKMNVIDKTREATVLTVYLKTLGPKTTLSRIAKLTDSVIELSPSYPSKK